MMPVPNSVEEYNIAWITALAIELAAATAFLDETYDEPHDFVRGSSDDNVYTWGHCSKHNVVLVSLPLGKYGPASATRVGERMISSLPHIKVGLLVGIGAGISENCPDIKLGDVAVSQPDGTTGGVVQYDFGKETKDGFEKIGMLSSPPNVLLNALAKLKAYHDVYDSRMPEFITTALKRSSKFAKKYSHPEGLDTEPMIYYGTIASGNLLIKDSMTLHKIVSRTKERPICLEMEATGLMNSFPCLVIRGICDYADMDKNDKWQPYATVTAAAFTKELLLNVPGSDLKRSRDLNKSLEDVQKDISKLHIDISELQADSQKTNQKRDDEKISQFLESLYSHSYTERKDRNPPRIGGTCLWFINHPLFQQWFAGNSTRILLATADPGCGKSVLARFLIDEVLCGTHPVCFFFFKDDYTDQRSGLTAVRGMLYQYINLHLATLKEKLFANKIEAFKHRTGNSIYETWNLLLRLSKDVKTETICVFDALDECDENDRSELIRALCNSELETSCNIKLLLLTRPYFSIKRDIDRSLDGVSVLHLGGENDEEREQISHEIDLVIKHRINKFCRNRDLDDNDRDFLLQKFISVGIPQRTYLWSYLSMAILEDTPGFTKGRARQMLETIPSTVDAAYEKILQRSIDPAKTRLILQIIVSAKRAFTVKEMSILLALDGTHTSYAHLEDYLEPAARFRHTLRELCGLFVILIDGRVYLLHQTAREFLMSTMAGSDVSLTLWNPNTSTSSKITWKNSLSEPESQYKLAERCLWLIDLSTIFWPGSLSNYAAVSWIAHLQSTNISSSDKILEIAIKVCDISTDLFKSWFCYFWGINPIQRTLLVEDTYVVHKLLTLSGDSPALVTAAFLGLKALVAKYLGEMPEQHREEQALSRALWLATCSNDADTVRLLLEHGIDPNGIAWSMPARDGKPWNQELFINISPSLFKHLERNRTALHIATRLYNTRTIQLLLNHGADSNITAKATDEVKSTFSDFFHWRSRTSEENRTPLMQFLAYSPVNEMGGYHVNNCHEIRKLLWSDASATMRDSKDNTVLHYAIARGCRACISFFLEHGMAAVLKTSNAIGETPLYIAMHKHEF